MKYRITTWLAAALMLSSLHATAASLSDIQVSNGAQQARITHSPKLCRCAGVLLYPTG